MRGILQEKGASGAKAAWLQAAGSPPAAAKRGSCPAAARQGRLSKRKRGGSCRGPAGRTGRSPGPGAGVSRPGAAGGLCQSGTSELCPPGVLQRAAPRRGALPGSGGGPAGAPGSAAPLPPPGPCLRDPHPGTYGPPPPGSSPQALTPSPSTAASAPSLLSAQQRFPQEGAAGAGRSPLPAARAAPGGTRGPEGEPGPAALELTRVLMRRRGPGTAGARSAHPGHGAGALRSHIWAEMALWKINAPASLFGERDTEVKRLLLILRGEDVLQWIHYIALKNQNTKQTLIGFMKTPIFSIRK